MTQPHVQLAITYWPRRSAYRWWSAFDRSEAREAMQQIAALGVQQVRIQLPWEDVQPAPRKINSTMLRAFEQVLDEVEAARLGAIIGLFPTTLGGALWLPRWLANPDPFIDLMQLGGVGGVVEQPDLPQVIYEGGRHTSHARDLFRDQTVIAAQQYLINEVVGYFGSHSAIKLWQLGEGLERIHTPASDDAVEQWYETTVEAVRNASSNARTLGVTSTHGLLNRAGPRPEHLAATCDLAGIAVDSPLPLPDFRSETLDALAFTWALASSLAGKPLAAVGVGLPTAADNRPSRTLDELYGQPSTTALVSGQQQAEYVGRGIERLHRLGAPLVVLADYADYPPALWRHVPLDGSIRSRTLGLIDGAGREKPALAAVSAASRLAEQPSASVWSIDNERYWRDPLAECSRLWREWRQS